MLMMTTKTPKNGEKAPALPHYSTIVCPMARGALAQSMPANAPQDIEARLAGTAGIPVAFACCGGSCPAWRDLMPASSRGDTDTHYCGLGGAPT